MAPPCRLFVIPARDVPVAAVIRRGPSRWYQVIRWDTRRDELTDGAWFKGRIYEERCDVSPDGELFVYFCHGGATRPGYKDSWTAVSRLPWLSALALWPAGTTYGGGGRFVDRRKLVLRNGTGDRPHPDHLPHGLDLVDGKAGRHGSRQVVDGADWSGYDCNRRLIFAQAGKLYRRSNGRDREIIDLNDRVPDPVAAPDWATRPIGGRERTRR
jgi:hypothetical protein